MNLVRLGVCALVTFGVLAFGADPPWAQLVLEAGAAALLLLWAGLAIRQREIGLRFPRIFLPAALLLGLGIAQCVLGASAYRHATELELVRESGCLLIALLAAQVFDDAEGRKVFLWFLVALAFAVSVLGIVQQFSWNGKMYWIFAVPAGGSPFGPYVNSDHFAGLVELTAPLGIALLLAESVKRDRIPLLLVFTIVPIGALFLTASRAGGATLLLETAFLFLLSRGPGGGRVRSAEVRTAALGATASLFVIWLGVAPLLHRINLSTPAELSHELRFAIYRDSVRLFLAHPALGTGLGSFRTVYPQYATHYERHILVHAHSDWLELLVETGVAGGLCGLSFLFFLIRDGSRLARSQDYGERPFHAGALAACSGLLFHDLVDFNLHLPANALLFLVLASLASLPPNTHVRQARTEQNESEGNAEQETERGRR